MTQCSTPTPACRPRALIVDDHDIVHLGVQHLLGERVHLRGVSSVPEALTALAAETFDLLLLDLTLRNDFSLGALPRLRGSFPDLKILVLTSMPEDLYAERALQAGADGYVMKGAVAQVLAEAVDTVMAGRVYLSPGQRDRLLRKVARGHAGSDAGARPVLSPRETEVLRLLAQGRSTREIAETLNRSVKTIETHKQSLKTKLGADSPALLVRAAVAWFGESA